MILVAPFLFTRNGCVSFNETGPIGDTIGGITAPITGLVGAVLVFLALRAQIVANEIIQSQIKDQKEDEKRKKEIKYISDLYNYFLKSIEDFDYQKENGNAAILNLLHDLAKWARNNAHNDEYVKQGKIAEYYGILTFTQLLLTKINNSNVSEEDKILFKELIKHHFESIVLPGFSNKANKDPCTKCSEEHNGIPFKYREIVEQVYSQF